MQSNKLKILHSLGQKLVKVKTFKNTHIYIYICVYVYVRICMYIYMYICIYIHICIIIRDNIKYESFRVLDYL